MTLPTITAAQITKHVTPMDAVKALSTALEEGLDPAASHLRTSTSTAHGELLYMPAEAGSHAGMKFLSVAPGNTKLGRERIQGFFVLTDAETLTPRCLVDGVELTKLRTSAVSALAASKLAPTRSEQLVVFGSGPQAKAHIAALRAVLPTTREVIIIGRSGPREEALAAWAIEQGLRARTGHAVAAKAALQHADVVVCATSADEPLFDASWVRDDACVIAVGSHHADRRELPRALLARAAVVVVETRELALREAGDIALAVEESAITAGSLVTLDELVRGEVSLESTGPRVFKSVGQGWQDLIVAAEIARRVPQAVKRYPVGDTALARR